VKNALKNFFSFSSKEDFWIMISFLCFFLGLVIQLIIIAFSFVWLPDQFGLPKVSASIFILATILTLVPILGYIAFVNFLLLFVFTFHGNNPFYHPWFYHLLGMAVFDIGMMLFMVMDRAINKKTKKQPY
jgi:hypothetical protein